MVETSHSVLNHAALDNSPVHKHAQLCGVISAILMFYVHKALKMAVIKYAWANMRFNEWAVNFVQEQHHTSLANPMNNAVHMHTG